MKRKVAGVYHSPGFHWVGDGFRVTNYFPSGNDFAQKISPFIMLDYHAPFEYTPTDEPRGVGVLHKEYHDTQFSRAGGRMHMAQIWVNLPKAHKMDPPRYQSIAAADKGVVALPAGAGEVRVIAGEYQGVQGPAKTFTPVNMFEILVNPGGSVPLSFPARQNTALLVMKGSVRINGKNLAQATDLVLFENEGEEIAIEAEDSSHLLLLNGEPINEPVVQHGPFVMNTTDEIRQAFVDFRDGKFGSLAA
jgi:redox-sensitive bicupin YhaK (pirin superfamily)